MTDHQQLVRRYLDGFARSDHAAILACLTDDVVWDIPGQQHLVGKAAFDSEIENPAFEGSPTLSVDRLVEDGDAVVVIGDGRGAFAGGASFEFRFCTAFRFSGDLIDHVESFVMPLS